jgi:hypothetical protein
MPLYDENLSILPYINGFLLIHYFLLNVHQVVSLAYIIVSKHYRTFSFWNNMSIKSFIVATFGLKEVYNEVMKDMKAI